MSDPSNEPVPPPTPSAADTSTGLTPNVGAGLSCVAGLITGIVFLVIEKKNGFVRFWAMQSTVVSAAFLLVSIVLGICNAVLSNVPVIGMLFALVLGLVSLVLTLAGLALWIAMMIQAFSGKEWRIPYAAKFAEQQLARLPKG